jgi:putative DNA primase/helicase
MDLRGARVAFAQEPENHPWNASRVKMLTGKDTIAARKMRQDMIRFKPSHLLLVSTNAEPRLPGSDQQAWKRRLQLIPFQACYRDDYEDRAQGIFREDKQLDAKLEAEAPGILHKLVQGSLEFQRIGLNPPQTVLVHAARYLKEQSALRTCFAQECVADPQAKTSANDLWDLWYAWATNNHEAIGIRTQFNNRLRTLGILVKDTALARGICFGIRPRAASDPPGLAGWEP